jgi:hypothetical protein
VKTVALLVLAVFGVINVGVDPDRAAVGQTVEVSGPAGAAVVLEPLETAASRVALGTTDAQGRLDARVPDVTPGSYRVVIAGVREAPVLEVTVLSQGTSVALLAFGLVFVLGVVVAGVVVHRRWRDAIS